MFTRTLAGRLDLPAEELTTDPQFNERHPIPCVLFKRYLNHIDEMPRDQRPRLYLRGWLRFAKAHGKGKLRALGAINSWLTAREIGRLRQAYSADDERI